MIELRLRRYVNCKSGSDFPNLVTGTLVGNFARLALKDTTQNLAVAQIEYSRGKTTKHYLMSVSQF